MRHIKNGIQLLIDTMNDSTVCMKPNISKGNDVLIISDSIINQLEEKRLRKHARVKVCCFGGSTISDMKDYITPLLIHNPSHILIHAGTNDAPKRSADGMITDLLMLKKHILDILPHTIIIISLPTIRTDSFRANNTLIQYVNKLSQLNIPFLDNGNIKEEHIGRKGLHLNRRGTGRLALNIMSLIRQL